MPRALILALLLAATAGCATGGEFPSLAPRAVEQLSMEEPIKADPPVPASAEVRARAAGLLGQARGGDAEFEAAYARALPAVRAAGPSGSDAWVKAHEAISRVEAARQTSTTALAELDRYVAERAGEPTNRADHEAMIAALRAAEAIVAGQQRRLAALRESVSRP